jgi:hypothetical protein
VLPGTPTGSLPTESRLNRYLTPTINFAVAS